MPETSAVDLSEPRRIHIVGVGGSGMSAIATVLAAMGHQVSGSDLKDSATLARLRAQGVAAATGHGPERVGDAEVVAVSTAVPERNPEVQAARQRGIPVVRRAEVLAAIAATRRCLAVSGTHGKTTTSSMLALVLVAAGVRPSFIVGGELNEIGGGAVWDRGEWFVVEADESDGTFLELPAEIAVVTNVEADHLDYYGSMAAIEAAFDRFLAQAPGPNIVCADEPLAFVLARRHRATTYGVHPDADFQMRDVVTDRAGVRFRLESGGQPLGAVALPVPGTHNARNATAAIVAAVQLGVPFAVAADALRRYTGVARRFEFRGEQDGVTFVDDYAHNPGKVAAVLDAAHQGGWRRVIAVFQPHRYTRTSALWREFGPAFAAADVAVITDIYAAGEAPRPGVTGKLIVNAVLEASPWKRVAWLPRRADILRWLRSELRPGDLCLTLGAGDITSLPDDVMTPAHGETAP
ncbi:MAG: UDP-N-acetylmuramate--L-alanine ligase [Acidimicrobiales bacterium]